MIGHKKEQDRYILKDRQTYCTDRQILKDRQADRQTERKFQTDRQIDRRSFTHLEEISAREGVGEGG